MNLDKFWAIINEANKDANYDIININENVLTLLIKESNEDIITWEQIFLEYFFAADGRQLRAAFYIIDGSYSEDAFDCYRAGLISFGQDMYLQSLKRPDSLSQYDFIDEGILLNAAFLSVAKIAYLMKNHDDTSDFKTLVAAQKIPVNMQKEIYDNIEFSSKWECEWSNNERSLQRICPQLFERFW